MKKLLLLAICCHISLCIKAQITNKGTHINIAAGMYLKTNLDLKNAKKGTLTNNGSIITSANFANDSDGIVSGSGTYSIEKDWTNSAKFAANNSTVIFNASTESKITSGGNAFYNLQLNKESGGNLTLVDQARVLNALNFAGNNNKVKLEANDLLLSPTATINGYDNNDFVVTNGSGYLIKEGLTDRFEFPVGYDCATYNPFTINQFGTKDDLAVRCLENVFRNGLSGAVETNLVANVSWEVIESRAGGSEVSLTAQWTKEDELEAFDHKATSIRQYVGTIWKSGAFDKATGTGPYKKTASGFTTLGIFSVGSLGRSPLELSSFKESLTDLMLRGQH